MREHVTMGGVLLEILANTIAACAVAIVLASVMMFIGNVIAGDSGIRSLVDRLRGWLGEIQGVAVALADHVDPPLTPQEQGKVWEIGEGTEAIIRDQCHACPNCFSKELIPGPSGGMSTNVECADCHLRWNAALGQNFPWTFINYGADYNQVRVAAKFARRRAGIAEPAPIVHSDVHNDAGHADNHTALTS